MRWDYLDARERSVHLLRVLKTLTAADGEVAPEEVSFLTQCGLQHGLRLEEIQAELASPEREALLPAGERERMEILYYLVFLTKSDGEVGEAERVTIHHFGLQLGFREGMIAQFVELADRHRHETIPAEAMLDRVRQYLN